MQHRKTGTLYNARQTRLPTQPAPPEQAPESAPGKRDNVARTMSFVGIAFGLVNTIMSVGNTLLLVSLWSTG